VALVEAGRHLKEGRSIVSITKRRIDVLEDKVSELAAELEALKRLYVSATKAAAPTKRAYRKDERNARWHVGHQKVLQAFAGKSPHGFTPTEAIRAAGYTSRGNVTLVTDLKQMGYVTDTFVRRNRSRVLTITESGRKRLAQIEAVANA
jgi:DNA-binding MarR family transcriptional regulator